MLQTMIDCIKLTIEYLLKHSDGVIGTVILSIVAYIFVKWIICLGGNKNED